MPKVSDRWKTKALGLSTWAYPFDLVKKLNRLEGVTSVGYDQHQEVVLFNVHAGLLGRRKTFAISLVELPVFIENADAIYNPANRLPRSLQFRLSEVTVDILRFKISPPKNTAKRYQSVIKTLKLAMHSVMMELVTDKEGRYLCTKIFPLAATSQRLLSPPQLHS